MSETVLPGLQALPGLQDVARFQEVPGLQGLSGLLAAALAGVAIALLVGGAPRLEAPSVTTRRRTTPLRPVVLALGAASGALLLAGRVEPRQVVLLLLASAVVTAAVLVLRRRAGRRAAAARRGHVLETCEGLTADLRAGAPPVRALERAAVAWPELATVVVAAQVDAEVPQAWRELGARPGAGELVAVAAAWQVSHETGSGLAAALEQVVTSLRQRRRTAALVASEAAAARATAQLLVALPVAVLAMSAGIGGDPVGFLIGTTAGVVCLAVGLALTGLGWWWLDRVVEGVLGQ